MGKHKEIEKDEAHFKKLLKKLEKANKEKDEKTFKLILKEVKEELPFSVLHSLVEFDRNDIGIESSFDFIIYLLECINAGETYYFKYVENNLKGLSRDIAYVYSKYVLYNKFNSIRVNYDFKGRVNNLVELFRQREREEDGWDVSIDTAEYFITETILLKCMATFDLHIDYCSEKIIDVKLLETLRKIAEEQLGYIDDYLYMLFNKVEKRRIKEVSKFYGNKLKDRNIEKYEKYKKIILVKSVGDKFHKNLRITETQLCEYYKIDSKSFNSWKNRNNDEYWDIVNELTEQEKKVAEEELSKIFKI